MRLSKKLLVISLLIVLIAISLVAYFYFQREAKEKEAEQIKTLLVELNEVINLIDTVRGGMPTELLETHEYLMSGVLEGKLYRTDPSFKKEVIMYHGAKTKSIYINPTIKIKKELWIPVLYHEVAHNYWHSINPVKTFEEFEAQLFDSENYATIVNTQAWDLVMKHYQIKKEELKTELEQRLFKIYSDEAEIYNEMRKGNPEAKELWKKIIEADIKEQKVYQKLLFEK